MYGSRNTAGPPNRNRLGDIPRLIDLGAAGGGLFGTLWPRRRHVSAVSPAYHTLQVSPRRRDQRPFAGSGAGRRTPLPVEVQKAIEQRLAKWAIEPQVSSLTQDLSNSVTGVRREVVTGARVPLSLKGDRLLDLAPRPGGARARFMRPFVRLVAYASLDASRWKRWCRSYENIYAYAGDVLDPGRLPQSRHCVLRTGVNTQVNFTAVTDDSCRSAGQGWRCRPGSDPAGCFVPVRAAASSIPSAVHAAPGPDDPACRPYLLD